MRLLHAHARSVMVCVGAFLGQWEGAAACGARAATLTHSGRLGL
jgi:hypothetical protein